MNQTESIHPDEPRKTQYDTSRKMMVAQFAGKNDVNCEAPVPIVTDQTDAIVKITAASICGSDLHLHHNPIPGMKKNDITGHEAIGIIEEVGSEIKNFKKGDRVVVSPVLGCGKCDYCKRSEWSLCDLTNINKGEEAVYGHHTAGLLGYSHTFGGFDGCQAEYVRVPYADINLFKIPHGISDKQAISVVDSGCTAYHGTFLADVKEGDKVVVFGCGPVGLLTLMWSKFRGANRVIAIDVDAQRLDFAKQKFGCEIVNAKDEDPLDAVKKLIPEGPDKVIDCVGFRFPDSLLHKIEFKLGLETDSPNIVNNAIKMVRKNGTITLIGDYAAYTNHFNIGGLMEKHLTINGGQVWPQKHYGIIFDAMVSGKVDPSVVITHTFPLSKCDVAYKIFDKHEDGIIKPLIIPDSIFNISQGTKTVSTI